MEAKELRIGNYVSVNNINEQRLFVYEIKSGIDIDNSFLYFEIPLTEEWLLKFGFYFIQYSADKKYKKYFKNNIRINCLNNNCYFVSSCRTYKLK